MHRLLVKKGGRAGTHPKRNGCNPGRGTGDPGGSKNRKQFFPVKRRTQNTFLRPPGAPPGAPPDPKGAGVPPGRGGGEGLGRTVTDNRP